MARLWAHVGSLARVAWPGAALGSVLAVLLVMADMARFLRTGLGTTADLAIVLVLSLLALALLGLLVLAIRRALHAGPPSFWAALVASYVLLFAVLAAIDAGGRVGVVVSGGAILLGALVGGAVAMVARRPSGATWVLFVLIAGASAAVAAWVWIPGTDPYLARLPRALAPVVPALRAEDPSARGPYAVRTLTYGSGTDRRRPEYGSGVAFRTAPVDASRLIKTLTGFKAAAHRWYWGFGAEAFPLNGRVWYPEGEGPFPLVVIVHGNHRMEDASDLGYAYLAEALASHGFISVSIDENFLNRSWSGDLDGELAARAWTLLQHLAAWRRWNDTPGHPFHRRVDMERIALIGHSRGGEAVAHAAAFNRLPCFPEDCTVPFDFGFSIQALVALAPIDGGYEPAGQPVPIENVSYLVLQGSHDGDVPTFEGLRPFTRARFSDGRDRFKAAVYVYRANHSQFNSLWGDDDVGSPFERFTLRRSLLAGGEQRRLTQVFVGGFLEASLHGRREYRPMFRDPRAAAAWLPATAYFTQFEDASFRPIADFGVDLTRGAPAGSTLAGERLTVWRHGDVRTRTDERSRVRAVHLGWKRDAGQAPARYRVMLPDEVRAASRLALTVADTREEPTDPIDFTIELVTADGAVSRVPLSSTFPLPPTPRVRFTKWRLLDRTFYHRETEPAFQTYELPVPARVREIRLVFDRTPAGAIAITRLGFSGAE